MRIIMPVTTFRLLTGMLLMLGDKGIYQFEVVS